MWSGKLVSGAAAKIWTRKRQKFHDESAILGRHEIRKDGTK
jgi:hypothetical protein